MNFSQVGISNMALQRIGARGQIASLTESSPNAVKINTVWDLLFSEVLSERDWKFAKLRVQLQQSTLTPVYGYQYAYGLPADFLRIVKIRDKPAHTNRFFTTTSQFKRDLPVWPHHVAPWVIETIIDNTNPSAPVYNKFLVTNYNSNFNTTSEQVSINYIRLITDYTQLMPGFVNCFANRLAAELAISVTEDKEKAAGFMQMYKDSLTGAAAQLECDDYLQDESGSNSWALAGRTGRWFRDY